MVHMLKLDATTQEGREATAAIVRGLGDGKVCVLVTAAEARATTERRLGAGFVAFAEKAYGKNHWRDSFVRLTPEQAARRAAVTEGGL